MNIFIHLRRAAALYFACAFIGTASAGTISGVTNFGGPTLDGTGPGMGAVTVATIVTLSPNNDNAPNPNPNDNNITVPIKRFDHLGVIDIEFSVAPSTGVTEYQVVESVDNNTGVPWTGYKMQLGYGVGAAFIPSPAGDGLDFDDPNYDTLPSSTIMPNVTLGQDLLTYDGGIQSTGQQVYRMRIDVPNINDAISNLSRFTLRQVPVTLGVPEPSTLVLFGLASLGICLGRRQR